MNNQEELKKIEFRPDIYFSLNEIIKEISLSILISSILVFFSETSYYLFCLLVKV